MDTIRVSGLPAFEGLTAEEWKNQVVRKLQMLEDTQICLADSHELQRDIDRVEYEYVNKIIHRQADDMDEIRQGIDPRHDIVATSSAINDLALGGGKPISGLYEMFSYVATGMNFTTSDRIKASLKLYKYLVRGFKDWDYNPSRLELSKISIDSMRHPWRPF